MIVKKELTGKQLAELLKFVDMAMNREPPAPAGKSFSEYNFPLTKFVDVLSVKRGKLLEYSVTLELAVGYREEDKEVMLFKPLPPVYWRKLADALDIFPESVADENAATAEPKPTAIPLTADFVRALHAISTLPLEYHPHTFGAWLVGIIVRYYENDPDLRLQLDRAGALNSELKDDLYFKLIVAHLRKHCLGETETPAEPMPGKTT